MAVGVTLVKVVGDARAVKVALQVGVHVVHRHVAHLHALAVGLEGGGELISPLLGVVKEYTGGFDDVVTVDDLVGGAAPLLVIVQVVDVDARPHGRALHGMT